MPTERMEVEVVCESTHAEYTDLGSRWCIHRMCNGSGILKARAAPGSLTAARLRLADAAEAWLEVPAGAEDHEWIAAKREVTTALAALRTARGEG